MKIRNRKVDRERNGGARPGQINPRAVQRPGANPEGEPRDLIFGLNPVIEALRAGRRNIEHVAVVEGAGNERLRELLNLARAGQIPIRRVSRPELERATGRSSHQGVMARIAAASYADAAAMLDELANSVGSDQPPLVLALDGLEDPRNFGALLRTSECAGV